MTKLSKVSFFLFITIYNYLWLRVVFFYIFYNNFGNMGFFYIIALAALTALLIWIIPNKLLSKNYLSSYKKSYFKFFNNGLLLLEGIFGICFAGYILSTILIPGANFYVIIGLIILCITIISNLSPKEVIDISTLFAFGGFIILTISMLLIPKLDASYIFPVKELVPLWAVLFTILFLADDFTILIDKDDVAFSKLNYILAILASIILFGLDYFLLLASSGDIFFKDVNWVGFVCLSIEPVSKYFGNFDFAYIYFVVMSCIFKYAYNMSLVKKSLKLSPKLVSIVLSIALFTLACVAFNFIPMDNKFLLIVSLVILLTFSLLFWFIKECYFVRKVKE